MVWIFHVNQDLLAGGEQGIQEEITVCIRIALRCSLHPNSKFGVGSFQLAQVKDWQNEAHECHE